MIDYLTRHTGYAIHGASIISLPEMDRNGLARMFAESGFKSGVEVGTAEGEFAEMLCAANPKLHLSCIDPWTNDLPGYNGMKAIDLEAAFVMAKRRLAQYDVNFKRFPSDLAVIEYINNSLDFVYIDANHELPWIMDDLCAWYEKVKPGGIVSGHDYHAMNDHCHVKYAVDCFIEAFHIKPLYVLGDRYHSWFFEKPGQAK